MFQLHRQFHLSTLLKFTCTACTKFARALAGPILWFVMGTAPNGSAAPALVHPVGNFPTMDAFAGVALAFEPNVGQTHPDVRFLSRGPNFQLLLDREGALLALSPPQTHAFPGADGSRAARSATRVRMRFVGAERGVRVEANDVLPGASHYLRQARLRHSPTEAAHFAQVRYRDLYPGIDAVFYGNHGRLEYDFIVAPGAKPDAIRLAFDGVDGLRVDDQGDLVLETPVGSLRQHRPRIYQRAAGSVREIDGRYVLRKDGEVAFALTHYDAGLPLVIDPVLSYSTFLGGKSGEAGTAIAVDAAGNAYVAGWTYSTNFPEVNPYDTRLGNSDEDVFVSKLNASGTALLYSTFIGGTRGLDYATGLAIDAQGNAYVTGTTSSNDFPVSTTAYQKAPASGGGAFVAKLGPAGNTLVYSTYLLNASNTRVAVDGGGNAVVTGQASAGFVTTPRAFQSTVRTASGGAPFALKLNTTGSAAIFSTIVGGTGVDTARAMALDATGNVYLAGSTSSLDFPVASALQSAAQGGLDGFVAKLDATGTSLLYATYFGGSLDDSVNAIAVDAGGNAYLAGETFSVNFPVVNAFQPVKAGRLLVNSSVGNAFVAKLGPTGNSLGYSSFLGGEVCTTPCQTIVPNLQYRADAAWGIAVDALGHAIVTGIAQSYTFPLVDSRAPGKTQDNEASMFVAKVSQAGFALLYSTLVYTDYQPGGSMVTGAPFGSGQAIAVDSSGNAYLATGGAAAFPTTPGALQPTSLGGDALIFKLAGGSAGITLASSPARQNAGQPVTLTAAATGPSDGTIVTFMNGRNPLGSAALANGVASLTTAFPTGIHRLTALVRNSAYSADSMLLHQVADPVNVCN